MNQIRKRIAKYKLKCPSRVPFSSPIFTSFPLRLSTISTHPLRLLSTTATNANVSYHRERKNGAGPSSRIKDRANLHSANVAATPCSLLPQDGRSLSRITSDACALFFSPESRTNQPPRPVFFVLCFFFFFFFDFLSKQIRANDLLWRRPVRIESLAVWLYSARREERNIKRVYWRLELVDGGEIRRSVYVWARDRIANCSYSRVCSAAPRRILRSCKWLENERETGGWVIRGRGVRSATV